MDAVAANGFALLVGLCLTNPFCPTNQNPAQIIARRRKSFLEFSPVEEVSEHFPAWLGCGSVVRMLLEVVKRRVKIVRNVAVFPV